MGDCGSQSGGRERLAGSSRRLNDRHDGCVCQAHLGDNEVEDDPLRCVEVPSCGAGERGGWTSVVVGGGQRTVEASVFEGLEGKTAPFGDGLKGEDSGVETTGLIDRGPVLQDEVENLVHNSRRRPEERVVEKHGDEKTAARGGVRLALRGKLGQDGEGEAHVVEEAKRGRGVGVGAVNGTVDGQQVGERAGTPTEKRV